MAFFLHNHDFQTDLFSPSILHGFGTKQFVNGYKLREAKPVQKALSLQNPVVFLTQTHSSDISIIEQTPKNSKVVHGDGVITRLKNVILTVRTADCVPIMFVDEKEGMIGISHQGWKGTYNEMAVKMVQKMLALGAKKESIRIAIGPAICANHYRIFGERLTLFEKKYAQWEHEILKKIGEEKGINLSELNNLQLVDMGISPNQIDIFQGCTFERSEYFYSYRRDNALAYGEMLHYVERRLSDKIRNVRF